MSGPPLDAVPSAAGLDTSVQSHPSCPGQVCAADVSGRVVYSEKKEWLYSNLMKVTALPKHVYVANTTLRFAGPIWNALRQAGGDVRPEWLLTFGLIVSFRDALAWCPGLAG